jgi:general L-amino acid transport system permease protein
MINNFNLFKEQKILIWLKKNLFNTISNSCLTIISLIFTLWVIINLIHWSLNIADWKAISANFSLFFFGRYPEELRWRIWTILTIFITICSFQWGIFNNRFKLFTKTNLIIIAIFLPLIITINNLTPLNFSPKLFLILASLIIGIFLGQKISKFLPNINIWLGVIWSLSFFFVLWLLQGGLFLETVKLDSLSGLILTLFAAIISIIISFPFGILLALGRQSDLPVIRWLSIIYIEVIRGLPLIGILFMSQVMLGFVLPDYLRPDRVVRAIAGLTIFSSAYLAENVRGGLQSIPSGQIEAAKALGLNSFFTVILIVLPQALKAVIPSIVGQFISLFKDTSLLAIVGLVDLLGISKSILSNSKYQGDYAEVYLFIAIIYWLCCYGMFLISKKLENN